MLPFRLVYHEAYDLNLGNHVFPSHKYKLIRSRLMRENFAEASDFVEPEAASDDDIELVHTSEWTRKLKNGTLTYSEIIKLEIPYSRQMVHAFWLAAGGTTMTARLALGDGVCYNVGGGFHHAYADHGEGFCAVHDVAVAIRKLQKEDLVRRALVVDCDVHHGNGTASIFTGDPHVFTLSIHQYNNYPPDKPPSTVDIHLKDGTGDQEYLDKLGDAYLMLLEGVRPDIVMYVAGADPYFEDQLGGLSLTVEGLKERDRLVIESSLRCHIPVAIVLAGGYALNVADTVAIHANTARAAKEALEETGWTKR